jgi:hypothetical protein
MLVRIARKHGVWDPWHDLGFAICGALLTFALLR